MSKCERINEWPTPNFIRAAFNQWIASIFIPHPPKPKPIPNCGNIREKARELTSLIGEVCPDSRERELSLANIEGAVILANASVARHT
jgi:hypothetical protein